MRNSFDYAVLRVVPRVDREEFINAGIVVFSPMCDYLGCRVRLYEPRLRALCGDIDIDVISRHLDALPKICEGDPGGGPVARLSRRQRFHWLVSPRSTVIQVSPVHTGICDDPGRVLDELFAKLVLTD